MSYTLELHTALSFYDVDVKPYKVEKKELHELVKDEELILKINLNPDNTDEFSKANRLAYLPELIPNSLKSFRIHADCHLEALNQDETTAFISALPNTLEALNLKANTIILDTNENRLLTILSACPAGLKEINLRFLNLDSLSPAKLTDAFNAFPKNLKKLVLSDNHLNKIEGQLLKKLFQTLPPTLYYLDLRSNQLTDKQMRSLLPFLKHSNIKIVKTFGNNLSNETSKELQEILENNCTKSAVSRPNMNSLFHPQATIKENMTDRHRSCTIL